MDKFDIELSILKRMREMFYNVNTDVRVYETDEIFKVEFTVNSDEAKCYGTATTWKKWLNKDLHIDSKMISGSRTKHFSLSRYNSDSYDYNFWIKKA